MKSKTQSLFFALIIVILFAGCGPKKEQGVAQVTSTPTSTQSPSVELTHTPIPTQTPTEEIADVPTEAPHYSFSLDKELVDVVWDEDRSLSISYEFTITNDADASPLDFFYVYFPFKNFYSQTISAKVDGQEIMQIKESYYRSGIIQLEL